MAEILEKQLGITIKRLSQIKQLINEGELSRARLAVQSLESSLYQALALASLENQMPIEEISCADYPLIERPC